jgi:hypothetical protein
MYRAFVWVVDAAVTIFIITWLALLVVSCTPAQRCATWKAVGAVAAGTSGAAIASTFAATSSETTRARVSAGSALVAAGLGTLATFEAVAECAPPPSPQPLASFPNS